MKAKIYLAEVPNVNGYIYPKEELERAITKFNIEWGVAILDSYPPSDYTVNLGQVAANVILSMDDEGFVVADISFLQNHLGAIAQKMLDGNLSLMPVSIGDISEDLVDVGSEMIIQTKTIKNLSFGKMILVPTDQVEVDQNERGMYRLVDK